MRIFDKSKFAERLFLENIEPEQLDVFLANGWYRMGQTIFTTHFLFFEQRIHSAIWLRLHLSEDFRFKRSLRKILKRNREKFTVKVKPFELTAEKELIYQRYAEDFKGNLSGTLKRSLLDGADLNVFDTLEINIYDGDRLIAFSFFDEGVNSLTSINGVYDPEYSSHSLGLHTMLEEIQYGIDTGRKFFYPGYFVPGNPRFDYKLRVGDVEFLEFKSKAWKSFPEFKEDEIPINKMTARLKELGGLLINEKIDFKIKFNPYFESNIIEYWPLPYLEYPIILCLEKVGQNENSHLVIIYNFIDGKYQALQCKLFDAFPSNYNQAWIEKLSDDSFHKTQMVIEQFQFSTDSLETMKDWIITCS